MPLFSIYLSACQVLRNGNLRAVRIVYRLAGHLLLSGKNICIRLSSFDTLRFYVLPSPEGDLIVSYWPEYRDTKVEVWHKRRKYRCRCIALELFTASAEMDSLFVRCSEDYSYHHRLSLPRVQVFRRSRVTNFVSPDLLLILDDFGQL